MSIVNDYLQLVEELWKIEQFNMWNPKNHSSLAYLLDRIYDKPNYQATYDKWLKMAQNKEYNEFAWEIEVATHEQSKKDERVSERILVWQEENLKVDSEKHKNNELRVFCLAEDKLTPDWFWEFFGGYIQLKKQQQENDIVMYLEKEHGLSYDESKQAFDKMKEHPDILREFHFYVKNNRFKSHNVTRKTIGDEVFTAKKLYETTSLSVFEAHNYLIYLRESPEEALEKLHKGI